MPRGAADRLRTPFYVRRVLVGSVRRRSELLSITLQLGVMRIFEEKPGVISEDSCWICTHNGYMYIAPTLGELIEMLNTEWEADKHIVG